MKKKAATKTRKRRKSINTKKLKSALQGMKSVADKALKEGGAMDSEEHLPDFREAALNLREAVNDFKREIKRRMLADKLLKETPGRPWLKLQHGKPKGSKNPDDYDVVWDRVH